MRIRVVDDDRCLLDVMMPGLNGRKVLQRLVTEKRDLPVVLLTARAEIQVRVEGLKDGADTYMTKPFESAELIARINAVLRRSARSKTLSRDGVAVDLREGPCDKWQGSGSTPDRI
ncbi:response regulator [Kroppenstedtia pulmonis]|uniref:Response regulator n=1 Tax=Kroppenstedtia pulmonis TaxID=1380685 RepID=A0A7D3Y0W1_9BACL|nr:response regulator [Kroppenstedtia pulmonis]QKG84800.1 response regulator [Kroppenstedtia pulmonis]